MKFKAVGYYAIGIGQYGQLYLQNPKFIWILGI